MQPENGNIKRLSRCFSLFFLLHKKIIILQLIWEERVESLQGWTQCTREKVKIENFSNNPHRKWKIEERTTQKEGKNESTSSLRFFSLFSALWRQGGLHFCISPVAVSNETKNLEIPQMLLLASQVDFLLYFQSNKMCANNRHDPEREFLDFATEAFWWERKKEKRNQK